MESTESIKVQASSPAEAQLKAKALQTIASSVTLDNLLFMENFVRHPKFNASFANKINRGLLKRYLS